MSSRRINDIEVLLERLRSLQIMNEASEEYKQLDIEMLTAPVPAPMTNMKNRLLYLRVQFWIQGSLMGTEQNLKTDGERYDYTLKVTKS